MHLWLHLPLAFASGFALGTVLAFLQFRASLRLYRQFIEDRLAAINLRLFRPRAAVAVVRVR